MCNDQCGVCKGTPVAVTGRPHPGLSTKLAIEKRRRRQLAIRWTVSRCAPIRRRFIERLRRALGPDSTNHTIKSFPCFPDGRHTWVEFRGYLRFFRDSAYLAKILGGATDGSTAGGSTVVYNLMSLPSIFGNSRCTNR